MKLGMYLGLAATLMAGLRLVQSHDYIPQVQNGSRRMGSLLFALLQRVRTRL